MSSLSVFVKADAILLVNELAVTVISKIGNIFDSQTGPGFTYNDITKLSSKNTTSAIAKALLGGLQRRDEVEYAWTSSLSSS